MKWQNKLKVVWPILLVEEAVKLLKPYRGRDGVYAMFSKTIGVITPKSVYTTTTQSGTHCIGVTWSTLHQLLSLRRLLVGNNVQIFIMHIEHEVKLNYDDVLIRPKTFYIGFKKRSRFRTRVHLSTMNPIQ